MKVFLKENLDFSLNCEIFLFVFFLFINMLNPAYAGFSILLKVWFEGNLGVILDDVSGRLLVSF